MSRPVALSLSLAGLEVAPAQVWGNVRLVPLVRREPIDDLRLGLRDYGEDQLGAVTRIDRRSYYTAYVPHGLVVRWAPGGKPVAAVDTRLGSKDRHKQDAIVLLDRMVKREGARGLRLLPLHLAMEGYLALQFGGPDVAHAYWSERALRVGMSPRREGVTPGRDVPGLDEALRVFERHEHQCGVLVFIGDQLASATVVSHPEDWAALHDALLTDFYGPMFAQSGWPFREVSEFAVTLRGTTLADLGASLDQARRDWAVFAEEMAAGLFPREVLATPIRKAGRFRLARFATGFDVQSAVRDGEHIGEVMVDDAGRLAYLKTYRLDRSQIRRGYLLSELARTEWDVERLATEQGHGDPRRILRDLEAADLGWMVSARS